MRFVALLVVAAVAVPSAHQKRFNKLAYGVGISTGGDMTAVTVYRFPVDFNDNPMCNSIFADRSFESVNEKGKKTPSRTSKGRQLTARVGVRLLR